MNIILNIVINFEIDYTLYSMLYTYTVTLYRPYIIHDVELRVAYSNCDIFGLHKLHIIIRKPTRIDSILLVYEYTTRILLVQ